MDRFPSIKHGRVLSGININNNKPDDDHVHSFIRHIYILFDDNSGTITRIMKCDHCNQTLTIRCKLIPGRTMEKQYERYLNMRRMYPFWFNENPACFA